MAKTHDGFVDQEAGSLLRANEAIQGKALVWVGVGVLLQALLLGGLLAFLFRKFYFAVLTNQRLLLLGMPIGAFGPKHQLREVLSFEFGELKSLSVRGFGNQKRVVIEPRSGKSVVVRLNTLARGVSGQGQFPEVCEQAARILASGVAWPVIASTTLSQVRATPESGRHALVGGAVGAAAFLADVLLSDWPLIALFTAPSMIFGFVAEAAGAGLVAALCSALIPTNQAVLRGPLAGTTAFFAVTLLSAAVSAFLGSYEAYLSFGELVQGRLEWLVSQPVRTLLEWGVYVGAASGALWVRRPARPQPNPNASSLERGQQVMVRWSDGGEYAAQVVDVVGDQARCRFPNGTESWVGSAYLRPVETPTVGSLLIAARIRRGSPGRGM